MKFPWYRSRLFWSGLTGWVMLVGSWAFYSRDVFSVGWTTGDTLYSLSKRSSALVVSKAEYRSSMRSVWPPGFRITSYRLPPVTLAANGIPPFRMEKVTSGGVVHNLHIAIWFIAVTYTAAWLGALSLWQRRRHRIIKRMSAVAP